MNAPSSFRVMTIVLIACGCGTSSSGSVDGPPANATPFACDDFAYCATDTVGTYVGTVDTPAGGAISDGMYRLAWEVSATSIPPDAANAMMIRGNQFVSGTSGGRGTLTTVGSHVTLARTADCDAGVDGGSANGSASDFDFTAQSDRLILFVGEQPDVIEEVFLKVTDACATVSVAPAQPGDSFLCRGSVCKCGAVEGRAITDECSL